MTTIFDPMARAFDSMARVFHGCGSWMTTSFDYVVGVIGWSQGLLAVGDAGK